MKLPFKRDTTAVLAKARAALAAAEAKKAELQRERSAKLLETDGFDAVWALDRAIAEQHATLKVCDERITALEVLRRKELVAAQEEQRAAAIELIEKKLAVRNKTALELEAVIRRMGELFFALLDSESVAPDWPFPAPRPGFGKIDVDGVRREMGWLLFSVGRPIRGETILPMPNNAGLGVAGIRPKGIAGIVAAHSANLLELLHNAPLGGEPDLEEATADNSPVRADLATVTP
jgi:hypothetical protein